MSIEILMPALSPTMTEGKLAKWFIKEGDTVAAGDLLAEIETDKATMEFEAVEDGVLEKIAIPEGTEGVAVNTPIAYLLEEGEDASAIEVSAPAKANPSPEPVAQPQPQPQSQPQPHEAARPVANNGDRIFASPLAKRLAGEAGLDLSLIDGSGPHGRIVKKDIEAAIAAGPQAGPPALAPTATVPAEFKGDGNDMGAYTEIPHSAVRKVIAQRLTESSRDIPHFFLTVDCEIDSLLAMRKDLNARSPEGEGAYKLSVNDFIIRAVALSMKRIPAVNVSWTDQAMRHYSNIDVSVAVATEDGLITPIIRSADQKGLAETSVEMKELAVRARNNNLRAHEFQGGGFTISNLGMYGIKDFCAIINPPQSCILAVGAGEQRPVVKDGALAVATVMSCTLSVDHRAVDGALGSEFLQSFKSLIEDPLTMLL